MKVKKLEVIPCKEEHKSLHKSFQLRKSMLASSTSEQWNPGYWEHQDSSSHGHLWPEQKKGREMQRQHWFSMTRKASTVSVPVYNGCLKKHSLTCGEVLECILAGHEMLIGELGESQSSRDHMIKLRASQFPSSFGSSKVTHVWTAVCFLLPWFNVRAHPEMDGLKLKLQDDNTEKSGEISFETQ